jgi:hypothetical protein
MGVLQVRANPAGFTQENDVEASEGSFLTALHSYRDMQRRILPDTRTRWEGTWLRFLL